MHITTQAYARDALFLGGPRQFDLLIFAYSHDISISNIYREPYYIPIMCENAHTSPEAWPSTGVSPAQRRDMAGCGQATQSPSLGTSHKSLRRFLSSTITTNTICTYADPVPLCYLVYPIPYIMYEAVAPASKL